MMSYGGVRFGLGSLGNLAEDAAAAAAGAMTGAVVKLPPGVTLARVVTHDPPPGGDLAMREDANDSAPQVPGGGAEKDGIVAVLDANASPTFAEVVWPGGARRPAARGFAHKAFLAFLPAGDPTVPPAPPGVTPPPGGSNPAESGLSTGAKVGIGLGVAALLGLGAYVVTR